MPYKRTVLPGGLRVVTEELSHVRSASLGFWIGVGSRDEDEATSGISHFVEHLVFKGTPTRSAREIAEAIDAVGGHINAFTSKECTCYYARVLDERFSVALELLADMTLHPRLDAADIEKEKGVITEEIMMYEDDPEELVHETFSNILWPDHPLGRAVQGDAPRVQSFSREQIISHYQRFYVPKNIVMAVAGNLPHERVVEEVERLFAERRGPNGSVSLSSPVATSGTAYREKDIEQVHLCLGSVGIPLGDKRYYALQLLSNVLGGGTSSRLFQEVREERGLAYSVYSFHNAYRDAGQAGIYLASSLSSAPAALGQARAEIERLKVDAISPEELERNRDQIKASILLGIESTTNRMTHMGKSELLLGRILEPEEIIRRIEAVTTEDVRRMAREIWGADSTTLAAVGPASGSAFTRSL